MAWKQLTPKDLRLVLAEDELERLRTCSLDPEELETILQQQLDMVSDAFRGAFQSKGYQVDVRDHYTPSSYSVFVLNYARFQIFTRFPMTGDYALDDNRKKQWEESQKMLKDPYIGVESPDYSDSPELSGRTDLSAQADAAISVPWQKFPAFPFDEGFPQAYPYWRVFP